MSITLSSGAVRPAATFCSSDLAADRATGVVAERLLWSGRRLRGEAASGGSNRAALSSVPAVAAPTVSGGANRSIIIA